MSELAREMERQSGKVSFTSGRTCPDCDETIREAKLIQTSLLPIHGFRNESVDIAFRFIPLLRRGGRLCRLLPFTGRSHRNLPRGRGRERLVGSHVCRARDGNPARDSQVRNGYRAGSFPVERASGAATRQGPLLLDLVRSFPPCHAGTHLLQRRDATTLAGLRKRVPAAWRGWVTFGNVPGSTYGRHVVQLVPGDCVLSRPTVFMNCATGRESNSAPPTWRRLGHNAGTNRQPNRRTSFSTARWPSPMAACRTMILVWWC